MNMTLPSSVDAAIGNAFNAIYNFTPYAEQTVVLVPPSLCDALSYTADHTGFDKEIIAFTSATFLCFPLAILMHLAPYGIPKHAASFLFGVFLLQFTIGAQWIHLLVTSLVTYLLLLLLTPRHARIVVPAFLIAYLSVGHIHRMYVRYMLWTLNFTTPQMVLTIKLYTLAYNLYDGELMRQAKESGCEVNRATQRCARFAVDELPSLFEFLGYAFCFSTVLAGPAMEYKIYEDACSGAQLYTPEGVPRGKIPSRLWPTLLPFVQSIVCMGLYIVGAPRFPLLDPIRPASNTPVVLTEEFLTRPFYQRYLYAYIAYFFVTMRYFFPWKSAEASTNLWYGGFEGFDENGDSKGFGNSANVDIKQFELAPSFRVLTRGLNKKTAKWLSRYVYARTNGSLMVTYFVSAFWHGFYPGYYLYFLSSPLMSMCERINDKKVSPYFDSGWRKIVWKVFNFVWLRLVLPYMAGPFFLQSMNWSLLWWKSYNYYGHFACILFYAAATLLPTPKQKVL